MAQLLQELLLFRRGVLQGVELAPHGEQVEVDAGDALGIPVPEHRADEPAPVAALRAEALVAELDHELREALRDLPYPETPLPRLERQAVARQRGRHHVEVLRQERDQLVELEHRAWPAVRNEQGQGLRISRARMDEMQLDALQRQLELRESVQLRFPGAPVEARAPGFAQFLCIGQAGTGGPGLERRLVGPARARKAFFQFGKRCFRDLQAKRAWGMFHRSR